MIATTRLRSGAHAFASVLISASVISGRKRWFNAILVDDARNRFALQKVPDELIGQRAGRTLVLLDRRASQAPAAGSRACRFELGRGEPEPRHAVYLGEERREAALDAALRDERDSATSPLRSARKARLVWAARNGAFGC